MVHATELPQRWLIVFNCVTNKMPLRIVKWYNGVSKGHAAFSLQRLETSMLFFWDIATTMVEEECDNSTRETIDGSKPT